jgi:diguanylate cyclase (GGDEF)-like protein/PAS domain S-box-containing protein
MPLKIGPVRMDFILFFLLFTVASLFLLRDRDQREQQYHRLWRRQAKADLAAALTYKRRLAEIAVDNRILTPRATALMAAAGAAATPAERNRIRTELFEGLSDDYRFLRNIPFQVLHFHLPDRTSFLRFHAPDKYGDRLATRDAIQKVLDTGKPADGFETGPLFSGHAFVFPIFHGDQIVGTVEVGLTLESFQADLNAAFPTRYRFLINQAVVQTMAMDNRRETFIESGIGPSFFSVRSPAPLDGMSPSPSRLLEIERRVRDRARPALIAGRPLSLQTRLDDGHYLVSFLPLGEEDTGALLFLGAYRSDTALSGFRWSMLITLTLVMTLLALLMGLHLWFRSRVRGADRELRSLRTDLAKETEARETAEESREQAERRLRTLARASMDALVLIDSAGRVSFWNEAAERTFGHPAADAMGKPVHDLVAPARFRERAQNRMEIFARTGEGRSIGRLVEFQALRKNGVEFPAHVSTRAIRIEDRWWAAAAVRDVTDQKRAEEQLLELQTIDSLTGLPNRSRFLGQLSREIARSRRYDRPLSLLIIDVDGFARINRRHGRSVGDHVLRTLGELIGNSVRSVDLTARIGDGEIGLLLTDTDLEQAVVAAERFRKRAADTYIPTRDGETAQFTISVGVAAMDGRIRDVETFLNRAEAALSQAKIQGRDQVAQAEKTGDPLLPEPEDRAAPGTVEHAGKH